MLPMCKNSSINSDHDLHIDSTTIVEGTLEFFFSQAAEHWDCSDYTLLGAVLIDPFFPFQGYPDSKLALPTGAHNSIWHLQPALDAC